MAKKQPKPRLRYGMMYWFDGRKTTDPNAWGSTEKLINACGNAAKHVSRSEFDGSEYRRAAIWDKWTGQMVRIYNATQDGMSIIRYRNGVKVETETVPRKTTAEIIQLRSKA